jgi:outer membrane protein assembly factor BamB
LRIGAGLISNGDKGKRFDVRAEVWRDYAPGSLVPLLVGWGETYDISGLSSSAQWAKEVTVAFSNVTPTNFDGQNNLLHLRILTRLAAGGNSNAAGLRLYFDAPSRPSKFGVILNQSPGAVANADPTSGNVPLTVNFSATGSRDPDGIIVKYEWDLDNGFGFIEYSGGTTSFEYESAGTYIAKLRVTDDDGAVGTASVTISAGVVPPQAPDVWPMFGHDPQHTHLSPFVGAQTANVEWKYTIGEPVWSSPAIDADGTLYVGSEDGKLYAINPNGTFKWSCQTGTYVSDSPAIGSDGTVYVGSYDNKLYAINPNGTFKWSFTTGGVVWSSPAIGTDGTVYVGSSDKKLYAIHPDGSLKWSYTTGDRVTSSPAIDVDGTVYVGSCDFKLYAFDPGGSLKWAYATGNGNQSPAIGDDGTVYVGSGDHKLYAINKNGTFKWSFTTGKGSVRSPAIGADGKVYVGSTDGNLYAFGPG